MARTCSLIGMVAMVFVAGGLLFGDDTKKEQPARGARASLPANWAKLGLTDDQKQKILATRTEYRTKIDALQREIKDLQKKELDECVKVLTDAQKARLKEIAAEKVPGATAVKDAKKPDADKKP
jgi:hypothetical protein